MSGLKKYEIVMNFIKGQVEKGILRPGDKIPSEHDIANEFDVSRHTVRKAISELQIEGAIFTEQGRGTFIAEPRTFEDSKPTNAPKVIGMIAAYINDTTFPRILRGIDNTVGKSEYSIYWSCTRNNVETEAECLRSMIDHQVSGIIVEPTHSAWPNPNIYLYERIREHGIPVLFIHGYYSNMHDDVNYVIVDDVDAGYKAVKHLIDMGHKKIGGIFKSDDMQGYARHDGYIKGVREAGLRENEANVVWMDSTPENDMFNETVITNKYLERLSDCTALVCYNDDAALALAKGMEGLGYHIPEDCSIVAFDNNKLSDAYKTPFSSMAHPKEYLGELAGESIIHLIKRPSEMVQKVLKVDLIEKASVERI